MKKASKGAGPEIQYWDSCLFIDYLMDNGDEASSRSQVFKRLTEQAELGIVRVAVSYIALAEVRPKRKSGVSVKRIEQLLEADREFFQWFPVTRAIAVRARRIGAAYSIEVPDAIHVATAIEAQAHVLYTYDGKHEDGKVDGLLALDGKIKDPDLPGGKAVRIEIPSYSDGEMFPRQNCDTLEAAKKKKALASTSG